LLIWGCTISMLLPDHWHFISIFVKRLWVLSFIFLLLSFLLKVVQKLEFPLSTQLWTGKSSKYCSASSVRRFNILGLSLLLCNKFMWNFNSQVHTINWTDWMATK
jgi:hypothetical protein